MTNKTLIGISGTALASVCCFTPALVILAGTLGVSAWLWAADVVLLPALIFFAGLTAYGFTRKETPC